jgi:hypothetical protein
LSDRAHFHVQTATDTENRCSRLVGRLTIEELPDQVGNFCWVQFAGPLPGVVGVTADRELRGSVVCERDVLDVEAAVTTPVAFGRLKVRRGYVVLKAARKRPFPMAGRALEEMEHAAVPVQEAAA